MNKLVKWEQKKILAMSLAWIMLFNLLIGVGMPVVYAKGSQPAEQVIVVDITDSNNAQTEGTNDGSETISDSDVSGNQQDVTDNDVSSGESFSNIVVGDKPVFVENETVAQYRVVNGQKHIYVSGKVTSLTSLSKLTWSTNSNVYSGTPISYSEEGNVYSFSFTGITTDPVIYVHAINSSGRYESLDIKLPSEFTLDGEAPSVSKANITSKLINKDAGSYSKTNIDIQIEASDLAGVAQYAIKTGSSGDVLSDLVTSNTSTITISSLPAMSRLWILVKDSLGNWSQPIELCEVAHYNGEQLENSLYMIDKTFPGVVFMDNATEEEFSSEDVIWYQDTPSVSWKVTENESGLQYVKGKVNSTKWSAEYDGALSVTSGNIALVDGMNNISVTAGDVAGNITNSEVSIGIDRVAPVVKGCILSVDEDKTYNVLPWGNFTNEQLHITVTAEDRNTEGTECSGVVGYKLYVEGVEIAYSDKNNALTISKDYFDNNGYNKAAIKVSAVDASGRESEPVPISAISDKDAITSDYVLIENIEPKPFVDVDNAFVIGPSTMSVDTTVVGQKFTIDVGAEDLHSGVYSYKVIYKNTKDETVSNNAIIVPEERKSVSSNVLVNAGNLKLYDDGIVLIKVVATDNAGNTKATDDKKFYVDKVPPEAEKFVYFVDESNQSEAPIVSSGDYGYFFHQDTTVSLYFSDGVEGRSSGIKSITCYTIDSEGNRVEREVGKVEQGETLSNGKKLYYADVSIGDGFKGHIYARATDMAGNAMEKDVSTKGVIVETMSMHMKEKHIEMDPPSSPYKDNKNNYMYAKDVVIPITVTDTMSGIKSIEWKVTAPYDQGENYEGKVQIGCVSSGDVSSGNIRDIVFTGNKAKWSIPEGGTDRNLVTKVQSSFAVTNNSNDIEVWVKMTDNAGNTDEDTVTIHIDKTKPTIEISFDNNDSDDVYNNIYSQNRTASIIVKERNFSPDKIAVEIANTMGGVPELSDWESHRNDKDPDESVHTAKVTFSEDGEYTMKVSGEDKVGNDAEAKSVDTFIIDKTFPKLEVTYSNNNAQNGNYYSDNRTVIITITERNFAPERVRLTGTITESGQTRSFPVMSSFTQRGDVYTATALCQEDGLYSFTVEYSDKAGNQGDAYTADAYHIDKTTPVIEILGVEPNSANNGDLTPQIVMTDNNYNKNAVNIQLVGANNGFVDAKGEYGTLSRGESFTFHNFPRESKYDDLYTIHVEISDLAGNVASDDITFSVNRFGSVYVFDESLKEIAGTYTQNPRNVSLTEVNIDTLEHDTIKVVMDYNGNSRDLVEGDDYKVQQVKGEGSWYRYNYNLDSSLFEDDGRYIVALYSVDRAGNINQNMDETKKAEISFGVDKTAPVVIPIDIEDNKQYAVDVKSATIAVNDNLLLKDVQIFVDGQRCEYTNNGESYVFNIPSSKTKQNITVLAMDMAGNTTEYIIESVLVNTNLFIRWYNNRPLFIGSLLAMFGLCGAAAAFLGVYRRRKYSN